MTEDRKLSNDDMRSRLPTLPPLLRPFLNSDVCCLTRRLSWFILCGNISGYIIYPAALSREKTHVGPIMTLTKAACPRAHVIFQMGTQDLCTQDNQGTSHALVLQALPCLFFHRPAPREGQDRRSSSLYTFRRPGCRGPGQAMSREQEGRVRGFDFLRPTILLSGFPLYRDTLTRESTCPGRRRSCILADSYKGMSRR